MPQDGDLYVLLVRRRTDPKQPEHPAHQHEPDTTGHARGSCQANIGPAQRRDPPVAPFTGGSTAAVCSARTNAGRPPISTSGRKVAGRAGVEVEVTSSVDTGRLSGSIRDVLTGSAPALEPIIVGDRFRTVAGRPSAARVGRPAAGRRSGRTPSTTSRSPPPARRRATARAEVRCQHARATTAG